DAHEVGVLHVVVGEAVALVAVLSEDDLGERGGGGGGIVHPRGVLGGVLREARQMLAGAPQARTRAPEGGEDPRRPGDVDRLLALAGEPPEIILARRSRVVAFLVRQSRAGAQPVSMAPLSLSTTTGDSK